MSRTAAIGMPKFEAGPQKSASRSTMSALHVQVFTRSATPRLFQLPRWSESQKNISRDNRRGTGQGVGHQKHTCRAKVIQDFVGANLRIDSFDGRGHGDWGSQVDGGRIVNGEIEGERRREKGW